MSLEYQTTTNTDFVTAEEERIARRHQLAAISNDVTDALKRHDHTSLCIAVLKLIDRLQRDDS